MADLPSRLSRPPLASSVLFTAFFVLFALSLHGAGLNPLDMWKDIGNLGTMVTDMVPPDTSRCLPMLGHAWVTIQMAVVGTVIGIVLSLPLAFLASRRHSPHMSLYGLTRSVVTFARSVPDLIWAMFFIPWVGLGPAAGTLAIAVDTIGFCGRFFAEHLEEGEQHSAEALGCIGAGRIDVLCAATIPAAMPAMVNSSLYAFEKAIRSSVVLGLVGAGGIGVELTVSMEMFRYKQAATIILIIFFIILVAEQASSWIRQRILGVSQ